MDKGYNEKIQVIAERKQVLDNNMLWKHVEFP